MLRNKGLIAILVFVMAIALAYNIGNFMKGRTGDQSRRTNSLPAINVASPAETEISELYILLENYDELVRYEVEKSNRNPFEGKIKTPLKMKETEIHPRKISKITIDSQDVAERRGRLYSIKKGGGSSAPQEGGRPEKTEKRTSKTPVKRQVLELKGVVIGGAAKFAIINDNVFSEGDVIGDERIIRITSESVLLEKDGEVRELKLERPLIPLKVRRVR